MANGFTHVKRTSGRRGLALDQYILLRQIGLPRDQSSASCRRETIDPTLQPHEPTVDIPLKNLCDVRRSRLQVARP